MVEEQVVRREEGQEEAPGCWGPCSSHYAPRPAPRRAWALGRARKLLAAPPRAWHPSALLVLGADSGPNAAAAARQRQRFSPSFFLFFPETQ